jgi:hypothetical protein
MGENSPNLITLSETCLVDKDRFEQRVFRLYFRLVGVHFRVMLLTLLTAQFVATFWRQ